LHPPIEVDAAIIFWTRTLPDAVLQTSGRSRVKAVRKDSKDDYDKLSLSTGRSFFENILKVGARRFITDAEFDRSGPKRFSCDETKC
jgi:hypothetical protein